MAALSDRIVYLEERLRRFEGGNGGPVRPGQSRVFGSRPAASACGSDALAMGVGEAGPAQVVPSLLPCREALESAWEPRLDERRAHHFGRSASEPGPAAARPGRADPAH